jgi:hypothetical protein
MSNLGDGDNDQIELNEDADSECILVSHCPNPLVTIDYAGDDEQVAENSCTAERMQKKHARQSKKKQMVEGLKSIQKKSRQSKMDAAKAKKLQAKSDAATAKQQAKQAKSDAKKIATAKKLPEVHEAAEQSESMPCQKKMQKHQRQQQKQQERMKRYDTMVDNTAIWYHDVYRKDTGTERGLGLFASRRLEIGKPTAK